MFTGDSDPRTTIEEADAWRYYTEDSFRIRVFPGGHFYLSFNTAAVAVEIARDLEYVIKRASLRESSPVILSLCAVAPGDQCGRRLAQDARCPGVVTAGRTAAPVPTPTCNQAVPSTSMPWATGSR
jgi:hypothetical protein